MKDMRYLISFWELPALKQNIINLRKRKASFQLIEKLVVKTIYLKVSAKALRLRVIEVNDYLKIMSKKAIHSQRPFYNQEVWKETMHQNRLLGWKKFSKS